MIKWLKQLAVGSCAIVIALVCAEGSAGAAITSLTLNQKAVAVADSGHTAITISGSIQCTPGDSVNLFATTMQAKSATLGSGNFGNFGNPTPLTCTGDVQDYSIEVDVIVPANGAFQNGPAVGMVAALDTSDNLAESDVVAKLVVTGSNRK